MKKFILNKFNFSLFDGEAAAGNAAGQQGAESQNQSGGETVVYGKVNNEPVAAAQTEAPTESAPTPEELRAKYDEFMTDENMKRIATEDTQKVINRRFREQKSMEEQLLKQNEVIQRLSDRYGVTDLAELADAIDNDSAIWEEAAAQAGMSVDQFRRFKQMEREANASKAFIENLAKQRQAQEQYTAWENEAAALKEEYPEFDLKTELENPTFRGLLGQKNPEYRVSMKQIYEIAHPEVLERRVAQRTAQQITDNIRARGARPAEGAMKSQSGIVYKSDVTKLTKKDRDEISRRVQRGEKISF